MHLRIVLLVIGMALGVAAKALPTNELVLDLDAEKGVHLEDGDRVGKWVNQIADVAAKDFVKQDKGRKEPGSGRPSLRKAVPELGGKAAVVFRQQELVCMDEDTFDGLTTGKGHTWITVLAVYPQRVGLKDVNSFFGNLRNGARYEGVWANVDDANKVWWGCRNGKTFGRFDANNPKLTGPKLEEGRFYILAGRMGSGTGKVLCELFVDDPAKAIATAQFPVDPKANPSKMAIGQERDAIEHPGKESFDGEIARLLIWQRSLSDTELKATFTKLREVYGLTR
jgi:hypothetical protein